MTDPAPEWFRRALEVPFTDEFVDVGGCPVHYLAWGARGRRGLVFVHGGGAHAHWWTHVAATFADDFRVLAIDLSGHGDSGHRDAYALEQWTDEVMAVAADGGIDGPPVVIGHSMGGFVTIATAAMHADDLAGVIICDSPVTEPDPEIGAYHLARGVRPRTRTTIDRGRRSPGSARCRPRSTTSTTSSTTSPGTPPSTSRRPTTGGWQWKFDRTVFEQFAGGVRSIALPYLSAVRCRLALLRSEYGLVTADIGEAMYERLGRVTPVIEIPEAGHHAMLDQPLILLTAIASLLADWDHSEPHRR